MNRYDARMIAEELYSLMKKDKPLGDDPPMTSEEAAGYLKMSMGAFKHIAINLPRVKAGRRWLYPRSGINKILTTKGI